jgi:hypothetical protein
MFLDGFGAGGNIPHCGTFYCNQEGDVFMFGLGFLIIFSDLG